MGAILAEIPAVEGAMKAAPLGRRRRGALQWRRT